MQAMATAAESGDESTAGTWATNAVETVALAANCTPCEQKFGRNEHGQRIRYGTKKCTVWVKLLGVWKPITWTEKCGDYTVYLHD
jgi:hypothetical protein